MTSNKETKTEACVSSDLSSQSTSYGSIPMKGNIGPKQEALTSSVLSSLTTSFGSIPMKANNVSKAENHDESVSISTNSLASKSRVSIFHDTETAPSNRIKQLAKSFDSSKCSSTSKNFESIANKIDQIVEMAFDQSKSYTESLSSAEEAPAASIVKVRISYLVVGINPFEGIFLTCIFSLF